MRGKTRTQQTIYLAIETQVKKYDEYGDWTGEYETTYTKDKIIHGSVSVNGTSAMVNAGINPSYDREITLYKNENLKEGDRLYIDTDTPDYVVVRDITTQKGQVFKYGIKKLV